MRMFVTASVSAISLIAMTILACSSFDSGSGVVSAVANADGATIDGPSPVDAATSADASDTSGPSLLGNGGFEEGCAGGWTGSPNVTFDWVTPGHESSRACRVCAKDNGAAFVIRQVIAVTNLAEGSKFSGHAYVQLAAAPTPWDGLYADVVASRNGGPVEDNGSPGPPLEDGAWHRVDATTVLHRNDADAISFEVGARSVVGACFLIDSASLTREP